MPRPVTLLLALALGAASAGLVACGAKTNPHLLSGGRADRITRALDEVQAAVAEHNCQGATQAVARLDDQLSNLPADTDPRLRTKLQEGATALATEADKECAQTTTTPTTTTTVPTTTTETTTTETVPTTTTTTPTTTTTTPTTPTTTTPTTPTTTTPGNGGATPTTP
jgi:hypothetical protein